MWKSVEKELPKCNGWYEIQQSGVFAYYDGYGFKKQNKLVYPDIWYDEEDKSQLPRVKKYGRIRT